MAAETLTGNKAKTNAVVPSHGYGATMQVWWGTYDIAANTEDGDIFELFYLPDGALVLGGQLAADDLDTGTEAIDLDLGWAANGESSAATKVMPWGTSFTDSGQAASATGFVNGGVFTGDAIVDLVAAGSNLRPIVLPTPLWFAKKTKVQLEANAAAGVFAAGAVTACLWGLVLPN